MKFEPWSRIHNFRQSVYICKLPWYQCQCHWAIQARKFEMNQETKDIIAGYPNISVEDAKIIFIRQAARDDFKKRSADFQALVEIPTPIKDATREQVIAYIGFLEKFIVHLKSYQQGLEIEYAKEVEPEIEAKQAKEENEKDSRRQAPRTLEGMLAKSGISKEALIAALQKQIAAEKK